MARSMQTNWTRCLPSRGRQIVAREEMLVDAEALWLLAASRNRDHANRRSIMALEIFSRLPNRLRGISSKCFWRKASVARNRGRMSGNTAGRRASQAKQIYLRSLQVQKTSKIRLKSNSSRTPLAMRGKNSGIRR